MDNLPVYFVDIDEDGELGVKVISLVDDPAIEVMSVVLNKEKLVFSDDGKREVVGPVLIPDKKIFRRDGYYLVYTKDVIERIVERFSKEKLLDSINFNHDSDNKVNGIITESWIKEGENDKSDLFGFSELPVGTWFVKMKIYDDDVYNYIKKNGIGFSIEGYFNTDKQVMLSDDDVLDIFKNIYLE